MTRKLVQVDAEGVPRFVGMRCARCQTLMLPARRRCYRCVGDDLRPELVAAVGRVYSYTIVHAGRPPETRADTIAVVDFDEDVRVTAKTTSPGAALTIGAPMQAAPLDDRDDQDEEGQAWEDVRLQAFPERSA